MAWTVVAATVDVQAQLFVDERAGAFQYRQSGEFVHAVRPISETAEKVDQITFQQSEVGLFRVAVAHFGVQVFDYFDLSMQVGSAQK
ncbi:hypothetical protein D3C85_1807450 [compost metagenome]